MTAMYAEQPLQYCLTWKCIFDVFAPVWPSSISTSRLYASHAESSDSVDPGRDTLEISGEEGRGVAAPEQPAGLTPSGLLNPGNGKPVVVPLLCLQPGSHCQVLHLPFQCLFHLASTLFGHLLGMARDSTDLQT